MCFTYYESFKNSEKKKIRNEEISNVTRLSTIDDRKFEKRGKKRNVIFLQSSESFIRQACYSTSIAAAFYFFLRFPP